MEMLLQCVAILKSGSQCRRFAPPGSETCSLHSSHKPAQPQPFYARGLPASLRQALAEAADVDGMIEEIHLLRTFIKDATEAGQVIDARRGIEALARVLRSERQRGASTDDLAIWLQETLAELDAAPPHLVGIPD